MHATEEHPRTRDVEAIGDVVAGLDRWLSGAARRVDGPGVVIAACGVWVIVQASGDVFEAVSEFGAPATVVGAVDRPSEVAAWLNKRFGRVREASSRRWALSALCERLDGAGSLSYSDVHAPVAGGRDYMPGVRVWNDAAPERSITAVAFESSGYTEMSDGRSVGRLASVYDPLGAVEAIERRLAAAAS